MGTVEEAIKAALTSDGAIPDSLPFAEAQSFVHTDLIGVCKSLASGQFIATRDLSRAALQLSKEGKEVLELGSPGARLFALVPAAGGILQDDLNAAAGAEVAKVGFANALKSKWLKTVKEGEDSVGADGKKVRAPQRVLRAVDSIEDRVCAQLRAVVDGGGGEESLAKADFEALKKRSLVTKAQIKSVAISKGEAFSSWGVKAVADLTHEMLVKGTWKETRFKPLNFAAAGKPPSGGALHPLMKVRTMFREIFLEMGFEEMKTNK